MIHLLNSIQMLEEDLLVGISIKMDVVKIMVVDWITFSLIVLCIMASVSLLLGVLIVAMVITREVSGLRHIRMMIAVQKMLV